MVSIMKIRSRVIRFVAASFIIGLLVNTSCDQVRSPWIKIDDFESSNPLENWTLIDTQNETNPKLKTRKSLKFAAMMEEQINISLRSLPLMG